MDATGHYGTACVGAPDEETAENGRKLGRRVGELVKKLRGYDGPTQYHFLRSL
jgi:NAD(P)H dehydrogenase (quinone)